MKKDLTLIATLPSVNNLDKVEHVIANPCISEVRINTGASSPYSVEDTLGFVKNLTAKYNKKLWIDLKGRQLRVAKWADPLYSCIELNHKVRVSYPARIYFRNGSCSNITHIKDGNKVFVNPIPREALGAGQSVNIISEKVEVNGYLTDKDKEYLQACKKLGIKCVMASFVERFEDLSEILSILPDAEIVSKIESLEGVKFITEHNIGQLMAARDDLYIQSGQNYNMLSLLRLIIAANSSAICASKIFLSLEKRETPDFADYSDLELMYKMGYRKFMLCDNICNYAFDRAIKAWREFVDG